MGRSGRLKSVNDDLIESIICDSNYIIQSDGDIWTLVTLSGKISVTNTWRQAGTKRKDGYVDISYRHKRIQVHRIIYRKFVGSLYEDLVINHKNGRRADNRAENIELVPQSRNNTHRFQTLGHKPVFGNTVITWDIARQIRAEYASSKISYSKLAKKYGLSGKGHISDIINNKIWVETAENKQTKEAA